MMMTTQQASLRPSPVPASDSATGQMDFGYHWIWTYGHLIPLLTRSGHYGRLSFFADFQQMGFTPLATCWKQAQSMKGKPIWRGS